MFANLFDSSISNFIFRKLSSCAFRCLCFLKTLFFNSLFICILLFHKMRSRLSKASSILSFTDFSVFTISFCSSLISFKTFCICLPTFSILDIWSFISCLFAFATLSILLILWKFDSLQLSIAQLTQTFFGLDVLVQELLKTISAR